jgi:ankyrin repeat protein
MSSTHLLKELLECCGSNSLSEDGLHEIIERHCAAPDHDDPNIDYEFFRQACRNEKVTEEILRYLLEYFPNAIRYADERGQLPLHHIICWNKNVTLGMVQLLIDAYPDSLRHETNNGGWMSLHFLCRNKTMDKEVGLKMLKLLLGRCPDSARHSTRNGNCPIHIAALWQSTEFCRVLVEAHPGSERITNNNGMLPFHAACQFNTVATAKYLYELYPESIHVADTDENHPIHRAIWGLQTRSNPKDGIEVVRFLLDCDPNVAFQKADNNPPLYWVCYYTNNYTNNIYSRSLNLNAFLKVLQILYDAYPEAIESNEVTSSFGRFHPRARTFINSQLTYSRQARDLTLITTRDQNGQLPLHRAISENATLGSIKLLVNGNPSAVQSPDSVGALPLHLACLHYDDACVVEFLINLDLSTIPAFDAEGNTVLHYACRGAKFDTIMLLLDEYGGVSVSARNVHNKLPIHLLLESNAVIDRDSIEYTESIYRLVRAYPDTLL